MKDLSCVKKQGFQKTGTAIVLSIKYTDESYIRKNRYKRSW